MGVPAQALDITQTGDRLVVGGGFLSCGGFVGSQCTGQGGFTILEAATGAVLRVEMPYGSGVNDVAFSPDGELVGVAVGSTDVRSANDGALVQSASAYSGSAHEIVFTSDGSRVISGITAGFGSGVRVFAVPADAQTNTFATVTFVTAMARSGNGQRLAVADDNLVVWVFDISNPDNEQLLRIIENPNPVESGDPNGANPFIQDLGLTFDGQFVATMSDQRVKLWRISDGSLVQTFESPQTFEYPFLGEFFNTAEISPDSSTILAGGYEVQGGTRGTLNVWNLATGELIAHYESEQVLQNNLRDTVFSPDSATIYVATAQINSIGGAALAIANPMAGIAPICSADIAPSPAGDNIVNVNDLLNVISQWGPCAAAACSANIVIAGASENRVDVDDLLEVLSHWGPCP